MHVRQAPRHPQDDDSVFPPALAPVLLDLLPGHPVLEAMGARALSDVLTRVFFASLRTEEHEHAEIRVALVAAALEGPAPGWKYLRFRGPCPCTTRTLLRLARAVRSDRLFVTIVGERDGTLSVTGLAREGFGADDGGVIKIRAPEPGNLEVWVSGRRVLEYARGSIKAPPEDVLLSSGIVRATLLAFAAEAHAPSGYIESIASILRHLAGHPHGGILVLSAELEPELPDGTPFATDADAHLWDVLRELGTPATLDAGGRPDASSELMRALVRSEIDRTVSEIGRMTALDGATILDRTLGVRGFGIVLPVRTDPSVLEMKDAAATSGPPFPLEQYGARHRAAASYAASHPGSLVFVASASGDIGCMLRQEAAQHVLLWRFRSADLGSPPP